MTDDRGQEPTKRPQRDGDDDRHNELGYRNVDEEAEHDERGSQGPGPSEPPPAREVAASRRMARAGRP